LSAVIPQVKKMELAGRPFLNPRLAKEMVANLPKGIAPMSFPSRVKKKIPSLIPRPLTQPVADGVIFIYPAVFVRTNTAS